MTICTNIYNQMVPYLLSLYNEIIEDKPVRGIGYGFIYLSNDKYEAYDLFTDEESVNKEKRIDNVIVKLKDKYGKNSVLKGIDYLPNATQRDRNKMIGGHNAEKEDDTKRQS